MRWLHGICGLAIALSGAITLPGLAAGERTLVPAEMIAWSPIEFAGHTRYTRVEAPGNAGHDAVLAECRNSSASGLMLERKISLQQTPILEWRWRVDSVYTDIDETEKSGDDYPARIYVVAERWPRFRSRIINYVWSSSRSEGDTWDNAFASQFRMIAIQSGESRLGEWMTERRDVLADFRRLHGIEPDHVDALAIMTDCDNAGQRANAWYGPIRWLPDDYAGDRQPAAKAQRGSGH
ncbi:MAG: DUF3047 domain-containing protein [Wenzhouxiangellaceae bacterium]|nr:DUF3047 domain-containing protein [Wenzhouxiangellaceae bacterium]MBS3824849.1 DUF3047 domain-containing protein [Wenzhouxiangellaceae bacterium]